MLYYILLLAVLADACLLTKKDIAFLVTVDGELGDRRATQLELALIKQRVNCTDIHGNTLLHVAIMYDLRNLWHEIIRIHPVNVLNDDNQTPLYLAVKSNLYSHVVLLTHFGADPNLGESALDAAVEYKRQKIVWVLLEAGADYTKSLTKPDSILMAVYNEHVPVLFALLHTFHIRRLENTFPEQYIQYDYVTPAAKYILTRIDELQKRADYRPSMINKLLNMLELLKEYGADLSDISPITSDNKDRTLLLMIINNTECAVR